MANLKLSGVNKVYPSGTLALYDVNLQTEGREFFVILGGENSGKSTLLRIISGLEELSSGEISIGGKNVTEADPKERELALVFRNGTLFPASTVYDNIAYGLKQRKAPGILIERRVKAVADILGLNEVLFRKPKALTAAQKQCVVIGRALVREPSLYLFDEPLAGLDDKLKAGLLNILANLQVRMEGTFVYATKNVSEALTVGTRIAVIKNGIIQQIDLPANLYDYPANTYVAFLIGSPTINFYNNAKIIKEDGGIFVEEGEFKLKLSDKIIKRFSSLEIYAGTGKSIIAGVRPEDVDAKGNINPDRLYLFDGETRLTVLARDEGYIKTDFKDADYIPPAYDVEERIIRNSKPQKQIKK